MALFDELKQQAMLQLTDGDMPDWLVAELLEIADSPDLYADRGQLVQQLIEQVRSYDPYAGAGCFSDSCSLDELRRTLRQLKA